MKLLTLLRHAKSSWNDASLRDFDRPLNKRGREAAPKIGKFLCDRFGAPDFILCSAAKRTKQSLERAFSGQCGPSRVSIEKSLYLAAPEQMLELLRTAPEGSSHVTMIAHNPGTHQLALELADPNRSDLGMLGRLAEKFPTAAAATFEISFDNWSDLTSRSGRLISFVAPREL